MTRPLIPLFTALIALLFWFLQTYCTTPVVADPERWHYEAKGLVIDWDMRTAELGKVEVR